MKKDIELLNLKLKLCEKKSEKNIDQNLSDLNKRMETVNSNNTSKPLRLKIN